MRTAQAKIDAKLFDQALADLKDVVANSPASAAAPAAYLLMAGVYQRQGRLDDAQAAYVELRTRYATNAAAADATFLLADLVQKSKRNDRDTAARALYGEVVASFPKSPRAPLALARKAALEEKGNLRAFDSELQTSMPAALISYRTLAKAYPTAAETEAALDEAGDAVRRSQAVHPRRPDARGSRAAVSRRPARRRLAGG